jgi:hypothetical protein
MVDSIMLSGSETYKEGGREEGREGGKGGEGGKVGGPK